MKTKYLLFALLVNLPFFTGSQTPVEVSVGMTVNLVQKAEIKPAYPIILNISVTSSEVVSYGQLFDMLPDSLKTDPAMLNKLDSVYQKKVLFNPSAPWYEQLLFVTSRNGQPHTFEVPLFTLQPFPEHIQNLGIGDAVYVDFGIDPEETASWEPGTFKLMTGLPVNQNVDTIWSKPVTVQISPPAFASLDEYGFDQLHFVGTYWIRRGQCDKAMEYAQTLYEQDSLFYGNTILMAEVHYCMNELERALELYEKAIGQIDEMGPDLFEPPVGLYKIFDRLQEQLFPFDPD